MKSFERTAKGHPRGSLLEFIAYVWMDAGVPFSGTRRWLRLQGLLDPSPEDLSFFSRKIKGTIAWRVSLVLALVVGWLICLRVVGLMFWGLNIVPPISGLAYGLTNAFGTKLPGENPASRAVARSDSP